MEACRHSPRAAKAQLEAHWLLDAPSNAWSRTPDTLPCVTQFHLLGRRAARSPAAAAATAPALRVLERRGVRALLQAGSMEFPMGGIDDGVNATHFSYIWEPESAETRARIAREEMPEMHVWVGLPDSGEILDVTTCFHQTQARRLGLLWRGPAPPPFLWERADQLPGRGVIYIPERRAIAWALVRLGLASHRQVRLVEREVR